MPIDGTVDPDALDRALEVVAVRHPMLKARFARDRTGWRAFLDPVMPLRIARDGEIDVGPFDLEAHAPLIRLALGLRPDGRRELRIVADHLIGDAISGVMLAVELAQVHDAIRRDVMPELPPIEVTFAELTEDALRDAADPARHAHVGRTFARPYVAPCAHHRPGTTGAHQLEIALDAAMVERVTRAAQRESRTLYEQLFGAFARVCGALTAASDLVIGTALAGRNDPRALRVFGPLVAMAPVRVALSADRERDLSVCATELRSARAHALPLGELARHLPPGTALADATGEAFFVTYVDVDALTPPARDDSPLVFRWDEAEIAGSVPASTDIHLAARRAGGALRLRLTASARALDPTGLAGLAATLRDELGAGTSAYDAVLIGYLPPPAELVKAIGGASAEALRERLREAAFRDRAPRLFETIETSMGRAGLVLLARYADELGEPELAGEVAAALELAASLGARGVSLAGMLPSRTGYARRLQAPAGTELTTGHATTAASIVLSLEHLLERTGTSFEEARVAFVGLGSVGAAACELVLETLGPARALVLSDLPRAASHTEALASRLSGSGARDVSVAHAAPSLPSAVLECDIVIGASSGGAVLEPSAVAPGTLVLDDSFPHLFDVERARARMRSARDSIFAGAGLIDAGPVTRTLALPASLEALRTAIEAARPARGLPSCLLEPLLRIASPGLTATTGLVDLAAARAYLRAARALGLRAAPLHLESEEIGPEVVDGARRARAVLGP